MRTLALLMTAACGIAGGACSSLLGIDNPTPDDGGGDPGDGGDGDGGGPALERIRFSIGDFRLAQGQGARLHAIGEFSDGTTQDVTSDVTYSSDAAGVANVTMPGRIDAGTQADMATITASSGAAQPGTVRVTVGTKTCRPVINEFQTHGTAGGGDEWVEILNPCTTAFDVTGWLLVYRSTGAVAGGDTNLMITLDGTMAPEEIRLYAGMSYPGTAVVMRWPNATGIMAQTDGSVGLRDSGGVRVDSVAYGPNVMTGHPFIETTRLGAMASGVSAQRLPFDGRDDDDSASDFMRFATPTPNAPNAP